MDASLSSGEEDPVEASLPLEAAGASSTGWLRDGRIGSVFAPTPWPADTKSMTKADTATASSADTMDTITTPRLNFFLRWRSARARCTTVPPASEVSACGARPRAASFGSAVVSAASSFAVAAACEPATDPAPTAAPAPPPALAPSFDPAEPFEPIASVSPGWISLSLSAERCRNFLYSCDATADTTEPTPTPIAEP